MMLTVLMGLGGHHYIGLLTGVTWVLISDFKADVNACDDNGGTPLHNAAFEENIELVWMLISEFKADVSACDDSGTTPLHLAASNRHLGVVRVLVSEFKVEVNVRNNSGNTPLHLATSYGCLCLVRVLLSESCNPDVNARDNSGVTPVHIAIRLGNLGMVRMLISEFKADVNECTDSGDTPLHVAASKGYLDIVRMLVSEFKADVNACNNQGSTPFDVAIDVRKSNEKLVLALMNEFHCDTKGGTPYIHTACKRNWASLIQALVQKYGIGVLKDYVNTTVNNSNKLFELAVRNNMEELGLALMNEFHDCTTGGTPYIHIACRRGLVNLVQALVQKHGTGILKDNVTARDDEGNTPLHVAAMSGEEEIVLSLINEFGCDVNVISGHLGWSLLHSACASDNGSLVRLVSQHISPWVVDNNGDTPLHICAQLGKTESVKALLELDPPVMIRDNFGQTPKDVEKQRTYWCTPINTYMKENKGKIYSQYEVVQRHAKKKYSRPEPITRAFVVGNSGAGKSSLVEALIKRESFLNSFKRVSESSVPPHTAGIP